MQNLPPRESRPCPSRRSTFLPRRASFGPNSVAASVVTIVVKGAASTNPPILIKRTSDIHAYSTFACQSITPTFLIQNSVLIQQPKPSTTPPPHTTHGSDCPETRAGGPRPRPSARGSFSISFRSRPHLSAHAKGLRIGLPCA